MTKNAATPVQAPYPDIVDGYFEVDLAGNFTRFNPAVEKITGYATSELQGMNNRHYTSPQTARTLFDAFNGIYLNGEPLASFECDILRKDRTTRIVELSVSLIRDDKGAASGFCGIARDITRRKEAERECEEARHCLDRIRRFDFLFDVSGSLAKPFEGFCAEIVNNVSMVLENIDPKDPGKFASFEQYTRIKNIERVALQGKSLLRRLTGFDEVEGNAMATTGLSDIVQVAGKTVRQDREDIEVHEQHEDELWPVRFDRVKLGQALLAICSNAVEALAKGGRLFLKTENRATDAKFAASYGLEPGPYVQISITDTGTGMDPSVLGRALNPFFTTKAGQAGLGLTSAYGIVKKHGGIIALFSEKGIGTTVTISLPAIHPPGETPAD
jgi:PAS domain S-box-containing protein